MSGIVNKIKEVLHKDTDHSTTHSSTTGTHGATTGTHGTTTGTHATGTHGVGSSTHGSSAVPGVHNTPSGAPHGTPTTHGTTHSSTTHGSTNAGPHSSNIANSADPRVDSDRDGSNRHVPGAGHTGTGHSNVTGSTGHSTVSGVTSGRTDHSHHTTGEGLHNPGSNTNNTGYYNIPHHQPTATDATHQSNLGQGHSSGLAGNPGAHSNTHSNTHSTTSGSTPVHNSDLLNKLDPRVKTDTQSHNAGTGVGHSSTTAGHTSSGVGHNSNTLASHNTTTAGPHDSNLANRADPRVDSDRDGSHNIGNTSHSTTHSSGLTGNNNHGSTYTSGPHQTDTANKLDPRVDSDRSNTHAGYGQSGSHVGNLSTSTHTGDRGGISHSSNAGPHDSNLANKADPRVDSDLDGKGNRHGANTGGVFGASGSHATAGSGTAQNTAGPHNSDLLNKIDPRVDSDRDHSKTVGGDKTHA